MRAGTLTTAAMPEQWPVPPSSYGPNLRALGGYLLVLQHLVVERCAQLIAEVTGANISSGWAAGVLEEAAGLAPDSGHTLIRALLTLVHALHVDETATRIGLTRHWLHVVCTPSLTLQRPGATVA